MMVMMFIFGRKFIRKCTFFHFFFLLELIVGNRAFFRCFYAKMTISKKVYTHNLIHHLEVSILHIKC